MIPALILKMFKVSFKVSGQRRGKSIILLSNEIEKSNDNRSLGLINIMGVSYSEGK